MEIKKVVVIGSGTMGSGIAAHLCNANVPVTLLDLTTEISQKAKERMIDLVENLRKAYKVGIEELDWMGDSTKKQAQYKLGRFRPKIGFPDNLLRLKLHQNTHILLLEFDY